MSCMLIKSVLLEDKIKDIMLHKRREEERKRRKKKVRKVEAAVNMYSVDEVSRVTSRW